MNSLLYSALDIAYIINSFDMGAKEAADFMERLWMEEMCFLHSSFRYDKHKFVTSIYHWSDYLTDKAELDTELAAISKSMEQSGLLKNTEHIIPEDFHTDLVFKMIRLKILYLNSSGCVKMKFRTLMNKFGYKRRSPDFLQHIRDCLMFYHLRVYLRDNVPCDIYTVSPLDTIIFRTI